MKFIKQMLEQSKLDKKIKFQRSVCPDISTIDMLIINIKTCNNIFANKKRGYIEHNINGLIWYLNMIDSSYTKFLLSLENYKKKYEDNSKADTNIKEKLDCMIEKKKEYHVEFEKIYDTFNLVTKDVDFPQRNDILTLMHKAFNLDGSKYYGNNIVQEIQ